MTFVDRTTKEVPLNFWVNSDSDQDGWFYEDMATVDSAKR